VSQLRSLAMGFLDAFRRKPKRCTGCGAESRGVHVVHSGIRGGEITDRLCHGCLIARLGQAIGGRNILFFEPPTEDGYVFMPLAELDTEPLAAERTALALDSRGATCASCARPARHVWMSLDDLDAAAMERQAANQYFNIPSEPADCAETLSFCDEHLLAHLRSHMEQRRLFFLTFRFPDASIRGCYW
jgi:hypothetical protein